MVVHTLHTQISQFASRSWVDCGQFGGGVGTCGLLLLAADTGGRLRWRLVARLIFLRVFLVLVVAGGAAAWASHARLVLALVMMLDEVTMREMHRRVYHLLSGAAGSTRIGEVWCCSASIRDDLTEVYVIEDASDGEWMDCLTGSSAAAVVGAS